MKYDIDSLINTFQKHANDMENIIKENAQKFPDYDKNPDWDFNLSRALETICIELKKHKDWLDLDKKES